MVNKFKNCVQLSLLLVLYQSGIHSEKIISNEKKSIKTISKKIKKFIQFHNFKISISLHKKTKQQEETKLICEGIFNENSQRLGYDSQTKTLVIPLNLKNILSLLILLFLTVLGSYYIWFMLTRKKCVCKICRCEYTLIEKLSSGGFGEIYKVCKDDTYYILKRCPTEDISEADEVLAEAKYLRDLDHRNIVKYIDDFIHVDYYTGKIEPSYYAIIIMEYCEGGDLKQQIDYYFYENSKITTLQIIDFLIQISEALAYLHKKNIIHRDIKSQNIFITKDNIIRIGDFGLAKKIKKNTTRKSVLTKVGTDCYMAPEVLRGDNYGKPADIWSLGCVIHELCTLIFMWMNEVPIGLLSLSCNDYLQKYIDSITYEEYFYFKDLLHNILIKDPTKRIKIGSLLRKLKSKKRDMLNEK